MPWKLMCACGCSAVMCTREWVYNVSFSHANGGDVLTEALHLHFSIEKCRTIWHLGGKKATISISESGKRWCLLASQTGVILLAPLLLFLSSYLISVLLWLGGLVWEENEETVVMAIFSFYKLLHHERYWKPFMLHLRVPVFHPLICLKQLLRERGRKVDTVDDER